MSDHVSAIKQHITEYVRETGTTKDALADKLGISHGTFYNRLDGSRPWLFDEVLNLSKIVGCTIDELITTNC